MKNVALHNLGCKVNSYELDVIQQMLQENGYNIVSFDEVADIYIVNTCTVTNIADKKSRQMLHRGKKKNPNAIVVAIGCYVQTGQEEVEMDETIDLAIGNNRKKDMVKILEEFLAGKGFMDNIIDLNGNQEYEELTLKKTAENTRAYIKIQDGCNQFCSYCIIPHARGRVRSRKTEDILHEIQGLVESGYQEVVLTGIHISSYGIDFENKNQVYEGASMLIDLVEEIHKIDGLKRIRLGSLEPRIITREFTQRLANLDKICDHFHLSLQSGCDETLKRMNRRYNTIEYKESVELLREVFERPAITTDIIVGFPGETKEEFEETYKYVDDISFYETHIFKYSKRKGTPAATMADQINEQEKSRRSNLMIALSQKKAEEFRKHFLEKEVEVLFEETKVINGKTYQIGHTKDYVKVALETEEILTNQIKKVIIKGNFVGDLLISHV